MNYAEQFNLASGAARIWIYEILTKQQKVALSNLMLSHLFLDKQVNYYATVEKGRLKVTSCIFTNDR